MDNRKLFDTFQLLLTSLVATAIASQVTTIATPIFSLVVPAAPFLLLVLFVLLGRYSGCLRGAVYGAQISAALLITVAYGWLAAHSAAHRGGGADIGMGLVMLSLPLVLVILMALGAAIGAGLCRSKRQ